MFCITLQNRDHTKGFSLIEIMVGMGLGLLMVLIIMQAFSVFENQKRTTTAASDAQENGLMAIVQLEQDIRNAGVGMADTAALNCTTILSYYNGAVPAPGMPAAGEVIAPVRITDGGTTGSDTITLMRGSNFLGAIPAAITITMPPSSAELNVSRTTGFADGNLVLLSQGGNCTLIQVTQVQDSALKIQHNPGSSGPYNPSSNFYNSAPGNTWPAYTAGAQAQNFGNLVINTYSVDSNKNLQMSDASGVVTTLVKDIVSLQAEYGIADTGTQDVNRSDQWVKADATSGFNTLDSAKVKRIKAVRITVVARSSKKEATNVTTSAPGGVDVSTLTDWQKYRYRVYTTIIPLRNIIWANV